MRFRFTLETKFVALASVLIFVFSMIANNWIIKVYHNRLISDAEERGLLLAKSTAISFTNTLLYENLDLVQEGGLLDNCIQDLISDSHTAILGINVYGNDGGIIATSDYRNYLKSPPAEVGTLLTASFVRRIAHAENNNSYEIAAPLDISSKRFGILIMEFSLADEYAQLAAFRNLMLLITTAITLVGILIAFLLARALARPIKRLADEMRKVRDPRYVTQLDSKRADEIGELERGFVDMLTRLKLAAEEKERQQQELIETEKLASVGTLVSGLAHEINNPLAGIRNCLRRIITRPEDVEQTRKYAKLMDDAWLRIENVVKGLLDFSRKKELVLQPTSLNQIIHLACGLVGYRLEKRKIKLQQQLARDLPVVNGDPHHLEQIFVNLLLNAVDATPEHGRIIVKTWQQDSKVAAAVTDTGAGIPPEIKGNIFDPFFTTKPVGKGTGLGLSVTKSLVEEHKGSIEVLSGKKGTTFCLYFPKAHGIGQSASGCFRG